MAERLAQAQALFKAYRQESAEVLLRSGLDERPNDPDLHAELGVLLSYTQREFEAVPHYLQSKGARKHTELGQILADYFHCRAMMAERLGLEDSEAKELAQQIDVQPGKVSIKISACLIVKDEERCLDRCLTSLKGVVDEIVVVDTGSRDKTIQIAESHGAKIGHFDWVGDFAAARNVSLELATGDWALWIDADEELAPESAMLLREAAMRPHFGGYYIRIVNFMDSDGGANQYVHTPVRLFRLRPEIRFEGRIHEQVLPSFERNNYVCATLQGATIYHYGYQAETMREKNKIDRTIGMLERETREHPRDAFHWFNLANAYCVARRFEDAIRAARIGIHFLEGPAPYGPVTYQILTTALLAMNRPEEALQSCEDARLNGYFTVVNQFELAHALYKVGKFEEALEAVDKVDAMPWPSDLAGDIGIKTYKSRVLRGQILHAMGRTEEGIPLLRAALSHDPNFAIAKHGLAQMLSSQGHKEEAAQLFWEAAEAPGLADCRILAAQCWRESGKPMQAAVAMGAAWFDGPEREDLTAAWVQLAEETDDPEYRVSAYGAISDRHPLSAEACVNYGRALCDVGRFEEGLVCFHRAIRQDPDSANAYFNVGDLLYHLERFIDAASAYESGLRLRPDHASGWFVLGNCFARLGHNDGAAIAYKQALTLDPSLGAAAQNLEALAA